MSGDPVNIQSLKIINSSQISSSESSDHTKIIFKHEFTCSGGGKIVTSLTYNKADILDIEHFKMNLLPEIKNTVKVAASVDLCGKASKVILQDGKVKRFKGEDSVKFKNKNDEENPLEALNYNNFHQLLESRITKVINKGLRDTNRLHIMRIIDQVNTFGALADGSNSWKIHADELVLRIQSENDNPDQSIVHGIAVKRGVLKNAVKLFHQKNCSDPYHLRGLVEPEKYKKANDATFPESLNGDLAENRVTINYSNSVHKFDEQETEDEKIFYIEFSRYPFGNGVSFEDYFYRQEKMIFEMPQLANHVMINGPLSIRDGNAEISEGAPTPQLIEGVYHVQKIDPSLTCSDDLARYESVSEVVLEEKNEPSKVNLIVAATPYYMPEIVRDNPETNQEGNEDNLADECDVARNQVTAKQVDLATITDYFNTNLANMQLAKENTPEGKQTHVYVESFNHLYNFDTKLRELDLRLGYVLQRAAAEHMGVDLTFNDFSEEEIEKSQEDYEAIKLALGDDKTITGFLSTVNSYMESSH
ncbi:MAG: hypothetical protein VX777_04985 [Chlamydiota bacterium]|nr:hypothetical protein [Chlamydiota bacterium]